MEHGLAIEQRTRADLLRAGQGAGPAAGRHQRPALHPPRTRQAHARCCASSPARRWPTPTGSASTPTASTSRPPQEMRALFARAARGLRQHAAGRRAVRGVLQRGRGPACRASRCPPGEDEHSWFVKEVERGLRRALPRRHPRPRAQAGGLRDRGHHRQMGFPGYFLVVADFINWAKDNGIRVGPGRGSGAGSMCAYAMRITDLDPLAARADLRAVPQPRARLDARLRRRLRRAPPRRGHPLRHREVRRGAGRADRHLRHDQGQAGDQGRRPGARLPLRRGRAADQGHAAVGDGQGHPAVRASSTAAHQRYKEADGVPHAARGRPEAQEVVETGARARGPEAAVGRARRRRHHVQRAADRPDPDHAPRAGRRRSSPSSTTRAARRSAWSRWTSWACATSPSSTTRCATSWPTARTRSSSRTLGAGRPGRPTTCSAAATPSASSSSTAARCARCCARCARTTSRTSRPSARSTGPARWA